VFCFFLRRASSLCTFTFPRFLEVPSGEGSSSPSSLSYSPSPFSSFFVAVLFPHFCSSSIFFLAFTAFPSFSFSLLFLTHCLLYLGLFQRTVSRPVPPQPDLGCVLILSRCTWPCFSFLLEPPPFVIALFFFLFFLCCSIAPPCSWLVSSYLGVGTFFPGLLYMNIHSSLSPFSSLLALPEVCCRASLP